MAVAKEIGLADKFENMGVQMVREVASKASDIAGVGTTTATVLPQALIREGAKSVAAGLNPTEVSAFLPVLSRTATATGATLEDLYRTAVALRQNLNISSAAELADALKTLRDLPGGGRLFRYELAGSYCNLTGARLNEYIRQYMGEEFTAKDFRTWGGTLLAAARQPRRQVDLPDPLDQRRHRRVGGGQLLRGRGAHRPFHSGLRFSAKARMPSRKSSEAKQDSRRATRP